MEKFPGGGHEAPEFKPAFELEPPPSESSVEDIPSRVPGTRPELLPPGRANHLGRAALEQTVKLDLTQLPEPSAEQLHPDTTTRPLGHTALSNTLHDDLSPTPVSRRSEISPVHHTTGEPSFDLPAQQEETEQIDRTLKHDLAPIPALDTTPIRHQDMPGPLDYSALDRRTKLDLAPTPTTPWRPGAAPFEHTADLTQNASPERAISTTRPSGTADRLDYGTLNRTTDLGPASVTVRQDHPETTDKPANAVTAFVDDSAQSDSDPQDEAYFRLAQAIGVAPADVTFQDHSKQLAGRQRIEMLKEFPDVQIGGHPAEAVGLWRRQDRNDMGMQNTCGLKNVQEIAWQLGVEKTQSQVVHMAVDQELCAREGKDQTKWGATTRGQQIELLDSLGLEGKPLNGMAVDDLAILIEKGYGVAVEVDAKQMIARYDDRFHKRLYPPGEPNLNPAHPNHSLHITGTVRFNGELVGFVANDPTWKPGVMIDVREMQDGWEKLGGRLLFARRPTRPSA